jgi:hypothetical protein
VDQAGESEFSLTCSKTLSDPHPQPRKIAGSSLQIRESDVRVLVITSAQDEIARHVNCASLEDICATISGLTQEVERRDQRIVKIVVQSNHLRERLSAKALFVANMCGKIVHANSRHIHTPAVKPYVGRESNNFGTTESVYTKVCNFHTGLQNTTTLLRAGTSSREIERVIPHVFVLDNIVEAVVHNIVYSARIGRPVSAQNKAIGRALEDACGCRILACLQIEESMFVHSFHVQMDRASSLRGAEMADAPDINVRINICRTGVVNLFVGVPGGIRLHLEPEIKIMPVCAALLEAIMKAT